MTVSSRERASYPSPEFTPPQGYAWVGIVYVDDSATARQAMRRALYPHGLLLETFGTPEELEARRGPALRAALFDFELADGVSGHDAALALRARHPELPVAFFTSADLVPEELASLGPVFRKQDGTDGPVGWLLAHARACRTVVLPAR